MRALARISTGAIERNAARLARLGAPLCAVVKSNGYGHGAVEAALARDLMTEDPVTIEPSASIHEAARTISRSKHNRLPVVEHGRLVGVVTRVDVLEALVNA